MVPPLPAVYEAMDRVTCRCRVIVLPLASSTVTLGGVAKLVASPTLPTGWVVKANLVAPRR